MYEPITSFFRFSSPTKPQHDLDAFATVDDSTTLAELLQRLEQPRQWHGRSVRALRPLADDRALLSAINHGEFALNGAGLVNQAATQPVSWWSALAKPKLDQTALACENLDG